MWLELGIALMGIVGLIALAIGFVGAVAFCLIYAANQVARWIWP